MLDRSPRGSFARSWVFQADPLVFDLRGALAAGADLTWLVRRYEREIHAGDRAYLWQSRGGGGVIAVTTVMDEPAPLAPPASQAAFHLEPGQLDGIQLRVPLRVDVVLDRPILRSDLLRHPVLQGLDIIRVRQGTNFRVTPTEDEAITDLIGRAGHETTEPPDGSPTQPGSGDEIDPARFWPGFEAYAAAAGFWGRWNARTSLRLREGRLDWSIRVRAQSGEAELLVEHGNREENATLFGELMARAPAIEAAFGGPLVWDEELGRRRQRVAAATRSPGIAGGPPWAKVWDRLLDDLRALERALRPHIADLGLDDTRRPPRRMTGWLGIPYQEANERTAVPRDPYEVDPTAIDRGTIGHMRTQNDLARLLTRMGLEPRSPRPGEPDYDLAWEHGGVRYVVEVKSLTEVNEARQLRLGLGQVLDYRHALKYPDHRVEAVLAVERRPASDRWPSLCHELGVRMLWPEVAEAELEAAMAAAERLAVRPA